MFVVAVAADAAVLIKALLSQSGFSHRHKATRRQTDMLSRELNKIYTPCIHSIELWIAYTENTCQ